MESFHFSTTTFHFTVNSSHFITTFNIFPITYFHTYDNPFDAGVVLPCITGSELSRAFKLAHHHNNLLQTT